MELESDLSRLYGTAAEDKTSEATTPACAAIARPPVRPIHRHRLIRLLSRILCFLKILQNFLKFSLH